MVKTKLKIWRVPVPPLLDEAVKKALANDMHVTKSDFIRDAVREKLEKMGFIETLVKRAIQ